MSGRPVLIKAWNAFLNREQHVQSSFNMIKTIESDHARVHEGVAYTVAETIAVASNAYLRYLLITNGKRMHLRDFSFRSTVGPAGVLLHEEPFWDANSLGTNLTGNVAALNRNNIIPSSAQLHRNPFVDTNSLGTQLDSDLMEQASGGPIKAAGGAAGGPVIEYILPNSGAYLISFVNSNAGSALVGSKIFWYEEG